MCVTCGKGTAPEQGEVVRRKTILETADVATPLTQLSENGQTVFFQTTARLVPQDVNSTETNISSVSGTSGLDVYEWDADSSGGCESSQGCTYLLSTGEDVGPSTLLGASKDGSNVFFESAAQLIAEDVDEFPDIYDARVGGGFAPSAPTLECTSCQGVGSPPPLFDVPASGTFMGAGNPGLAGEPTTEQELTKALKACRKGRPRRRRAACEKRVRRRYGTIGSKAKRSAAHTTKGETMNMRLRTSSSLSLPWAAAASRPSLRRQGLSSNRAAASEYRFRPTRPGLTPTLLRASRSPRTKPAASGPSYEMLKWRCRSASRVIRRRSRPARRFSSSWENVQADCPDRRD